MSLGLVSKEGYYLFVGTTSLTLIFTPLIWKILSINPNAEQHSLVAQDDYSFKDNRASSNDRFQATQLRHNFQRARTDSITIHVDSSKYPHD